MRDQFKDEAYWAGYLEKQEQRIVRFSALAGPGSNAELRQEHLLNLRIDKVYALYSSGAPVSELAREYVLALDVALALPTLVYGKLTWLLEMAVLLDVDISAGQCALLREKVDTGMRLNDLDHLGSCGDDLWVRALERCFSHQDSPDAEKRVLFPGNETFAALVTEVQQVPAPEAEELIRKHMKIWYKLHRDYPWYDSHKNRNNVYAGYWAFDCAALAKLCGLSGTAFQGVRFFPADLLPDGGR